MRPGSVPADGREGSVPTKTGPDRRVSGPRSHPPETSLSVSMVTQVSFPWGPPVDRRAEGSVVPPPSPVTSPVVPFRSTTSTGPRPRRPTGPVFSLPARPSPYRAWVRATSLGSGWSRGGPSLLPVRRCLEDVGTSDPVLVCGEGGPRRHGPSDHGSLSAGPVRLGVVVITARGEGPGAKRRRRDSIHDRRKHKSLTSSTTHVIVKFNS